MSKKLPSIQYAPPSWAALLVPLAILAVVVGYIVYSIVLPILKLGSLG